VRPVTLHAYVAAAEHAGGRTRMGVVFADAQGRTLRKIGRTLPGATTTSLAVFRGIVCALWNSRRLGGRRVVVHCPDPDVAAYVIYRANPTGPFERVGTARPPAVVFVDRDVVPGTYRYAVAAEDASARPNESARSNEVTVTVP